MPSVFYLKKPFSAEEDSNPLWMACVLSPPQAPLMAFLLLFIETATAINFRALHVILIYFTCTRVYSSMLFLIRLCC